MGTFFFLTSHEVRRILRDGSNILANSEVLIRVAVWMGRLEQMSNECVRAQTCHHIGSRREIFANERVNTVACVRSNVCWCAFNVCHG